MLRHAFRLVNSVIFLVGPQNFRSQRAVERIGGIRAGLRADAGGGTVSCTKLLLQLLQSRVAAASSCTRATAENTYGAVMPLLHTVFLRKAEHRDLLIQAGLTCLENWIRAAGCW